MEKKPIPRRPDALQPEVWVPIQDAPRKGMSLKTYRLLYRNLMLGLSFGVAFAIFGSASWLFRVAPINLRTSRIPAMENKQRVVLEVSNFLERDGGPRILTSPPAAPRITIVSPPPAPPPVTAEEPRVEEPRPEDLPAAEVVEMPPTYDEPPPPVYFDASLDGAQPVEQPPSEQLSSE